MGKSEISINPRINLAVFRATKINSHEFYLHLGTSCKSRVRRPTYTYVDIFPKSSLRTEY